MKSENQKIKAALNPLNDFLNDLKNGKLALPAEFLSQLLTLQEEAEIEAENDSFFKSTPKLNLLNTTIKQLNAYKKEIISLLENIKIFHEGYIINDDQRTSLEANVCVFLLQLADKNTKAEVFFTSMKKMFQQSQKNYNNNHDAWKNDKARQDLLQNWREIEHIVHKDDNESFNKLINKFLNDSQKDQNSLKQAQQMFDDFKTCETLKEEFEAKKARYGKLIQTAETALKEAAKHNIPAADLAEEIEKSKNVLDSTLHSNIDPMTDKTIAQAKKSRQALLDGAIQACEILSPIIETVNAAVNMKKAEQAKAAEAAALSHAKQHSAATELQAPKPKTASTEKSIEAYRSEMKSLVEERVQKYKGYTFNLFGLFFRSESRGEKLEWATSLLNSIDTKDLEDIKSMYKELKKKIKEVDLFGREEGTANERAFFKAFEELLAKAKAPALPAPSVTRAL